MNQEKYSLLVVLCRFYNLSNKLKLLTTPKKRLQEKKCRPTKPKNGYAVSR